MATQIPISLGAILALLVLSAFFSGTETSLTAASPARMHTLEQQGDRRASLVNRLWRQKERLIGIILLGKEKGKRKREGTQPFIPSPLSLPFIPG